MPSPSNDAKKFSAKASSAPRLTFILGSGRDGTTVHWAERCFSSAFPGLPLADEAFEEAHFFGVGWVAPVEVEPEGLE